MFLSGAWIANHAATIIKPFDVGQIDCSAYEMRIGAESYVSPEAGQARSPKVAQLRSKQSIAIPPGQFAFLITRENVEIPIDLFGMINMKYSLKIQGLVNVSGFHVDPGYRGKLVYAVFNAGPKTIILREGDRAFLIWFARLDMPCDKYSYKKKGFESLESKIVSNIPRESASLNSFSVRIEKIENAVSNIKWIGGIILGIAVGVAINWLSQ